MAKAIQHSLSVLDALKECLSEQLGNALYRLYVQEHNPFSADAVVDAGEPE